MEREKCQNVFQQIRRREYGIKQGPRSKFEILKTLLLNVSTIVYYFFYALKFRFSIFITATDCCYVSVYIYTIVQLPLYILDIRYVQYMYNFL